LHTSKNAGVPENPALRTDQQADEGAAKNAMEDLETLRNKHLSVRAEKGLMIDQFS
jgi:hypothetical protein